MKLESIFKDFLENTVNLNYTRYNTAIVATETMRKLLKNNDLFGDKFIDLKPQGSFRQETIIKPVDDDAEFDVDLLFEMEVVDGWEPKHYLEKLAGEIRKLDRYKDLVDTRGKTRCVTIDYESDFHIDLVPSVTLYSGQQMIMNKTTNAFEATDGDGYAQWFESKNKLTGKKALIKVVRLIKYIRDSQGTFEAKSVVLTTLLGNLVSAADIQDRDYPDVATAFVTLINRLDQSLQANPTMRTVVNPVLPSEQFNRHWDQEKYRVFREQIHKYAQAATDAYNEPNESESLKKWQKVFGKEFKGPSLLKIARELILSVVGGLKVGNHAHRKTLASIGVSDPGNYPLPVTISADLYWGRSDHKEINRTHKGKFSSGAELPPHHWLKYQAGGAFERYHQIYWQVVNTGSHAQSMRKLRGEIEAGSSIHWEPSLFTGVHWIECFVVDSRTNTCVGRSGPFYVVFKNINYPYDESTWS